jgi:hypothetical protein
MAQEESSREVHRERRGAARSARPVGAPARVPVPLKSVARNLHKSVEWRIAAPIVFRYLRCVPFDNVCRVRRRDFGADWVLRSHGLHFVAARSEHSGKGPFFGFCRASCVAGLVRDREAEEVRESRVLAEALPGLELRSLRSSHFPVSSRKASMRRNLCN